MVDVIPGRFSAHFEYDRARAVPTERFAYLSDSVAQEQLTVAALAAPSVPEPRRSGEGGDDCAACANDDRQYLWTDEHWRVATFPEPQALFLVIVSPRRHYQELPDLPPERAAELGPLLQRMEAALRALGDVGQVHTHKWGDGGAHLHLWQIVRPLGMLQARGVGATIWLRGQRPMPAPDWAAAGQDFAAEMVRRAGGVSRR